MGKEDIGFIPMDRSALYCDFIMFGIVNTILGSYYGSSLDKERSIGVSLDRISFSVYIQSTSTKRLDRASPDRDLYAACRTDRIAAIRRA